MIKTTVKQNLQLILEAIEAESVSWGELAYLFDHRAAVKRYFPDNSTVWEWAGIPESEWDAAQC